jgi:hypothetical protein
MVVPTKMQIQTFTSAGQGDAMLINFIYGGSRTSMSKQIHSEAMPWLRRLAAGLPPWRPGFDPGSVHVGFVVDKVALGQVFPPSSSVFPCQFHSIGAPLLGKGQKIIIIVIFIIGLRNKPHGCSASVVSAAGPFTTKKKIHSVSECLCLCNVSYRSLKVGKTTKDCSVHKKYINFTELLQHFVSVQDKHHQQKQSARAVAVLEKSMMTLNT